MRNVFKGLPREVTIGDEYAASGYIIGGAHGPQGLKILCPDDYTAKDLECAYKVYLYCCAILDIEPREFNEVV